MIEWWQWLALIVAVLVLPFFGWIKRRGITSDDIS